MVRMTLSALDDVDSLVGTVAFVLICNSHMSAQIVDNSCNRVLVVGVRMMDSVILGLTISLIGFPSLDSMSLEGLEGGVDVVRSALVDSRMSSMVLDVHLDGNLGHVWLFALVLTIRKFVEVRVVAFVGFAVPSIECVMSE